MAARIRRKSVSLFKSIGAITGGWLDTDIINNIDMNSYAKKSIVEFLRSELRLLTPHKIKQIQYFCTFKKGPAGTKVVSNLYLRRGSYGEYLKFGGQDLNKTGASINEYYLFLHKIGAKKIKDAKEIFENINL